MGYEDPAYFRDSHDIDIADLYNPPRFQRTMPSSFSQIRNRSRNRHRNRARYRGRGRVRSDFYDRTPVPELQNPMQLHERSRNEVEQAIPLCLAQTERSLPPVLPLDEESADKKEDECVVCKVRKMNRIVIVDCGHTSVCNPCLQPLNECPICRAKITHAIRFYPK